MAKRLAVMLTAVFLPLMFISTAPAQAVGIGRPVIVSPTGTVANGSPAEVTIDFADAPTGTYGVEIDGQDSETYLYKYVAYDGVTDTVVVSFDGATLNTGTYDVAVRSADNLHDDVATFTVAEPPIPALTISNVSVSPMKFYPLVRDDYRDTTKLRYTLNRSARVAARVLRTDGTVIRYVDLGTRMGDSWTWNGRKNNGDLASPGYYNIKITARVTDAPASTKSVVRQVHLATGYVTKTNTKSRTGYNTSSDSHSVSCYVDYSYYDDTVGLDCWGGSYAKVKYGFSIPSSAYNITWGVTGYQGCCSSGSISKTGTRTTRTHYQVSVKVTNWRSYTVEKVRVSYSYKRRI